MKKVISIFLKPIDLLLAGIAASTLVIYMSIRAIWGKRDWVPCRKLLVLDMAYTLEMIRNRQLHEAVTCRDLNGFFTHVWSVHPCATVIPPEEETEIYGPIQDTIFSEKHTIVEGKIGRYPTLNIFPLTNFFLAQWGVYFYLNHLLVKEKIAVVRAGDPYYGGLWALAIARANDIPCAVRVNVNYDTFYESTGNLAFPRLFRKRWVEKLIDKFTLSRMDLVAGANQDNLNFAIKNGARIEVTTIFRYGNLIHKDHFIPINERPSPIEILKDLGLINKPFSLTISRLEPLKHIDDVLKIIKDVNDKGYSLYGLIVGDGRLRNDLNYLAKDLKISERIIFAGNRDQEWLAKIIPCATIVISPFMGRALTEAALGGIPIVAYDIDWQSELIQNGKTGELVPYRDLLAMEKSVIKYLEEKEYARRMGDNVRLTVNEMMNPQKLTLHEINEYNKLFKRYYNYNVKPIC